MKKYAPILQFLNKYVSLGLFIVGGGGEGGIQTLIF